MTLRWRKTALLAKLETAYGVDAAPVGAENAIEAFDIALTPMDGRQVERDIVAPYFGSRPRIAVETHVALAFSVELAGSGTAGVAPAIAPLLRACGMAGTAGATLPDGQPTAGVTYRPVSDGFESLSIAYALDGVVHRLTGARGTWTLTLTAQRFPTLRCQVKGLWVPPEAGALPEVNLAAFTTPVIACTQNTTGFALHGHAGVLAGLTLALGNTVEARFLVGAERIDIIDRQPRGSVSIEAPDLAAKDYFATAGAGSLDTLHLVHGTQPGGIVTLDCPTVQLLAPSYSERQGIAMLDVAMEPKPQAGNDEIVLSFR